MHRLCGMPVRCGQTEDPRIAVSFGWMTLPPSIFQRQVSLAEIRRDEFPTRPRYGRLLREHAPSPLVREISPRTVQPVAASANARRDRPQSEQASFWADGGTPTRPAKHEMSKLQPRLCPAHWRAARGGVLLVASCGPAIPESVQHSETMKSRFRGRSQGGAFHRTLCEVEAILPAQASPAMRNRSTQGMVPGPATVDDRAPAPLELLE